jgi:hypothetical protein
VADSALDEVSFTGRHEAIRDGDEVDVHRPGAGVRTAGRSEPRDRPAPRSSPRSSPRPSPRPSPRSGHEPEPDEFDHLAVPQRHPVGAVARFVVVVLVFLLGFSLGSAVAGPGDGSMTSKLAGWARDKHLGFVVDALH